jgi:flagellar assembly protein FliH
MSPLPGRGLTCGDAMKSFVPKGRSVEYRPWQLKSLEGGSTRSREHEEADRARLIHRKAHEDGVAAGYAQGVAQAQAEVRRLTTIVNTVQTQLSGLEHRIAEDVVRLALTLAQALVRESLKVHPELIEAIVRETVRDVPPFGQTMRLRLHPDDAKLIEAKLEKELGDAWCIIEDTTITPGGCRIETAACDVDATLESRWQKLVQALAQEHEWTA